MPFENDCHTQFTFMEIVNIYEIFTMVLQNKRSINLIQILQIPVIRCL